MENRLGIILKTARKNVRLTQAELASKAKLSVPTISLLETGRGNLSSWKKALDALKLSLRGRNLPPAKDVGKSIALLRRRRGLSQRALAAAISTTHPTIVKLERKSEGRLDVLSFALLLLGAGPVLSPKGKAPKFFAHAAVSSAHHGWETPKELLEVLYQVFGRFDLDPCSPTSDKRHAPIKSRVRFTLEDDGLEMAWHGTVFLNPPYGRTISLWTRKAREEVECGNAKTVVSLLPVRTDTRWWHDDIAGKAQVIFFRGRLSFGKGGQSAPFPSALVLWGGSPAQVEALLKLIPGAWKP